jgi:hypothetical protein
VKAFVVVNNNPIIKKTKDLYFMIGEI